MRLILSAEPNLETASLEDVWLLFTSSGTFASAPYLDRGYTKLDAFLVGGGGSGGYGRWSSSTDYVGGNGGGGGGGGFNQYKDRYLASFDGIESYAVGLGGTADTGGGDHWGGNTTFAEFVAYGGAVGGLGSLGTDTANGWGGGGGGGAGVDGRGVRGGNGVLVGANGGAAGPNNSGGSAGGKGGGGVGHSPVGGQDGVITTVGGELKVGGGGGGGGRSGVSTAPIVGPAGGDGYGLPHAFPYADSGRGATGQDLSGITPFSQLTSGDDFFRYAGAGGIGGLGQAGLPDPLNPNLPNPQAGQKGVIVLRIHQG